MKGLVSYCRGHGSFMSGARVEGLRVAASFWGLNAGLRQGG